MSPKEHNTIRGRLKAARKALGLTDRQMAAKLGLRGENAKDDLRKMEEGMRAVTGPVLVAAEALARLHQINEECGARGSPMDSLIRIHVIATGGTPPERDS